MVDGSDFLRVRRRIDRILGCSGSCLDAAGTAMSGCPFAFSSFPFLPDETSVRTQKDVSDAISVVDGALDYALGEATTVGAYISRLRTTDANIVTMNETTTASESTIRDADMAKEMTSYMKNNVLLQASQSMLAQANRSSTDVLKLLQ